MIKKDFYGGEPTLKKEQYSTHLWGLDKSSFCQEQHALIVCLPSNFWDLFVTTHTHTPLKLWYPGLIDHNYLAFITNITRE